jgi:hypothetical protein
MRFFVGRCLDDGRGDTYVADPRRGTDSRKSVAWTRVYVSCDKCLSRKPVKWTDRLVEARSAYRQSIGNSATRIGVHCAARDDRTLLAIRTESLPANYGGRTASRAALAGNLKRPIIISRKVWGIDHQYPVTYRGNFGLRYPMYTA